MSRTLLLAALPALLAASTCRHDGGPEDEDEPRPRYDQEAPFGTGVGGSGSGGIGSGGSGSGGTGSGSVGPGSFGSGVFGLSTML